jgi:hypothetical protein
MAQGDANKVWIVPSDFGKALEGFTRMLGAPGEDGVFRFEPSRDYVSSSRPEEDDEGVAGWFETPSDPHVAAALRAAEEVARKEVSMSASLSPPIRPPSGGQTDTGRQGDAQADESSQRPPSDRDPPPKRPFDG